MDISETSICRADLLPFCGHMGLDIGYGGDPIKPEAITMDMPKPYTTVGKHEQNLRGDATDLYWFKDNVLDYVYSSHLLEDFLIQDIPVILKEWLRVIKPGGNLILYLPDDEKYRSHCVINNELPNEAHKNLTMSLNVMTEIINEIKDTEIIHKADDCGAYSFQIVIKKLKEGS